MLSEFKEVKFSKLDFFLLKTNLKPIIIICFSL
jgi:hypothetical protein